MTPLHSVSSWDSETFCPWPFSCSIIYAMITRRESNMQRLVLKTFGTVCLSVLLAYSGVAWALEDCLRGSEDTGSEQPAIPGPDDQNPSADLAARFPDGPIAKIHCLTAHHEIDAIVRSSDTTSLTGSRKGIRLKLPLSNELTWFRKVEAAERSHYLDWFVSSSPPGFLSRHLLLSVFLI